MDLNLGWEIDMTINMLGIDIAKNTFQLHGADYSGKAVHKKRLARRELASHLANLPPCTIVLEACGGADYWARGFQGKARRASPNILRSLQSLG